MARIRCAVKPVAGCVLAISLLMLPAGQPVADDHRAPGLRVLDLEEIRRSRMGATAADWAEIDRRLNWYRKPDAERVAEDIAELSDDEKASRWADQVRRGKEIACYNLGKEAEERKPARSTGYRAFKNLLQLIEKHCKEPE